ncbi:TPA: hypothetical protein ACJIXD_005168, partial [Escherichia coli]
YEYRNANGVKISVKMRSPERYFYSLFFPASELPYLQRNRKNHSGKQQDSHANRGATYYVLHQQV